LQDETIRLRAFLGLSLSGFFLAALGIFQFSTGLGIPAPWDIERRITSVFDYPNALGLFLAPLLSALLVFGICTWKNRLPHEKTFLAGACTVMLLAIILAKTEAALVAVPAAVFISLFISPLILRKHKIIAGVFASLALVGAFAFPHIRAKLLLQDFSGGVRLSQWKETIELLKDHPITGAGIGYYPELLRTSYHHDWQYEIFQYPHNILLNIWVELGILGVVLFLVGACYLGRSVWKQRSSPLPLAAGAALLAMAIHGLVDVPFFKNDLAMMTVVFVIFIMGAAGSKDGNIGSMHGSTGSK
jgi:O-antigen ligase